MSERKISCGDCRHFHPETQIKNSPVGHIGHNPKLPTTTFHSGQCRAHAPTITNVMPQPDGTARVGGGWPPTVSFQWCGEFAGKK